VTPTIQEEDEEGGEEEEEEEEEEEGESEAEEAQEKEISAESEGEARGKDTSPKLELSGKPKARLGHPYLDGARRLGAGGGGVDARGVPRCMVMGVCCLGGRGCVYAIL